MVPKKGPSGKLQSPPTETEDDFSVEMPDASSGVKIPDGPYEGRVINFEKSKSKTSGNPMWVVDYVITSGPHSGTEFRSFLALTPAAAWKVAETLRALGFKQKVGEKVVFTKADVMGRRVLLNIELDTYEGKERSIVKTVEPHPKGPGSGNALKATPMLDEDDDEAEEEELPVKKGKAKAKPVVEEEEEDEDLDEDLDEEDEDLDEEDDDLDDEDDFDDEDEDLDDDDEDLDDDEDEEDDEAPHKANKRVVKAAPAKKAAPVKKAAKKVVAKKTTKRR